MRAKRTTYALLGLTLAVFAVGALLYPSLPDRVASHWNAGGDADGSMGKFWGVFLFPCIMMGMFLMYALIPKIDPLKKNIAAFQSTYDMFWTGMFLFFIYVFGLSMAWNTGHRFNFTAAMLPAMSALFYGIGVLLEKTKRNWFMGIRTPWTLSSDGVWDKTHRLGGRLFKLAAVVSLCGLFIRDEFAIAFVLVPVALASVVTVAYSYVVYKKLL